MTGIQSMIRIIGPKDNFVRGKDLPGIQHTCNRPYHTLTVDQSGDCFLCLCEEWLPVSVGNITDFGSLEEVWSHDIAQMIQQDVNDKKFTNCAVEACGITLGDRKYLEAHYHITVNLDNSCNLACPSCRKEMINIVGGAEFENRSKRINHLLYLLNKFEQKLMIVMIGNGDPLASTLMRPIILNWQPKNNQYITLFTNGLLMEKLLPQSKVFSDISQFKISVDAGSKDVYERVRRPGKFQTLTSNLNWLSKNKSKDVTVLLNFTLSADNAQDIENFVDFCYYYGFSGNITKIADWGTFDQFADQDVIGNANHPLRDRAIEGLRYADKKSKIFIAGDLQKFL